MAERRMFSKKITQSDEFLAMPQSTQNLYWHLNMEGDDEGFVNSPKKVMNIIKCSEDDMKLLIAKRFLIAFESGVIVIKHWKMHNAIRSDRFKSTSYIEERSQLNVREDGAYTFKKNSGIPNDNQLTTKRQPSGCIGEDRIGKISLDENSIDENSNTLGNLSNSIDNEENTQSDPLTELIELIESEFKRPISGFEIDKVRYWFDSVGYRYIVHALRECIIYRKKDINYLDKLLVRWTNDQVTLEMLDKGEKHK